MEELKDMEVLVLAVIISLTKRLLSAGMLMPPVFQAMSKTHDDDQGKNHGSLNWSRRGDGSWFHHQCNPHGH